MLKKRLAYLSLSVALLASSCSWSMVTRSPPRSEWEHLAWSECTPSAAPAVGDVLMIIGSLGGGIASGVAIGNSSAGNPEALAALPVIAGVTSASLHGASAYYGLTNSSRCRDFLVKRGQLQR